MNILAELQKRINEEGISLEEKEKRLHDFERAYLKLREEENNKWYSKMSVEQRKKIHLLILLIYKMKNRLGGFTYNVINDKHIESNKPIIYAVTHIGKFDIEVVSEVLNHYYLLSGDFEHLQGIIDAYFLGINGVLYFNEKDKKDRINVRNEMIKILKKGGNLLYFPEGTWNLTPNLPVLPLYSGIIDIARASNAIIVPIAVEQYGKKFEINIGNNFDINSYGDNLDEKKQAINDLRDIFASLKWEIWEMKSSSRDEISESEWEEYIKARLSEWPYFTEDYIKDLIYKPKDVILSEEVYTPIRRLIPKKENAFLFDKRIKG